MPVPAPSGSLVPPGARRHPTDQPDHIRGPLRQQGPRNTGPNLDLPAKTVTSVTLWRIRAARTAEPPPATAC